MANSSEENAKVNSESEAEGEGETSEVEVSGVEAEGEGTSSEEVKETVAPQTDANNEEASGEEEEEEDEEGEEDEEEAEGEGEEEEEEVSNEASQNETQEMKDTQEKSIIAEAPTNDMEIDEMLEVKSDITEEINTQLTIEQDCPVESECVYRKVLIEEVSTNDIPERLQSVFENRLDPSDEEIKKETDFIFYHMSKQEKHCKTSEKHKKELKSVIQKVLEEYRRKRNDIPYIEKYRGYLTNNLLTKNELWELANLDLKWNEYWILSKSVAFLLGKLNNEEVKADVSNLIKEKFGEVDTLKNVKSYLLDKLSYFTDQIDSRVDIENVGDLHYSSVIEKFYADCFISPCKLAENVGKSSKLNSPSVINKDLNEVVKSYFGTEDVNTVSFNTAASKYIASDIASYPGLLDYYQLMYSKHVTLSTIPTEGYEKDIDVSDPCFSVKRLKNVPFSILISNPQSWLYICKLKREGKIQVKFHTETLESELNKELISYFTYNEKDKKKEKKGKKSKDESGKIIEKWEGFNRQIINQSVQKVCEKIAIECIDQKLKTEAIKEIEQTCAEKFKDLASTSYTQDCNEVVMAIFYNNSTDIFKYSVENAQESENLTVPTQDKFEGFMQSKEQYYDKIEKIVEEFNVKSFSILICSSECKLISKNLHEKFPQKAINEIPYDDLFKALIRNSAKIAAGNEHSQQYKDEKDISEDLLSIPELLGTYTMYSLNLIGGMWKDNEDKNIICDLRLHPLQSELDRQSLLEILKIEIIKIVNEHCLDMSEFDANTKLLQFVCGLGTRKYTRALRKIKKNSLSFERRQDVLESQIFTENVLKNCIGFLAFKSLKDFDDQDINDSKQVTLYLDSSRIHPENYALAKEIIADQSKKHATTFGELKKSLENLKVNAYVDRYRGQGIDLTSTIQFIVNELKEPCFKSLVEINIDKLYPLLSILNDPLGLRYKVGSIVPFTVHEVDEENKQIKCKVNSVCFTIKDLQEEGLSEKYPIGSTTLAKIKSMSTDTYEIDCKLCDLNDDQIKRKLVPEYLKEYFEFNKEIDLYNILNNECKKSSPTHNESEDATMSDEIDYCLNIYNISEKSYLSSKEAEVRNSLKTGDIGEYYFHKADNNEKQLKLSWKFYDDQIFTYPVFERVIENQNKEIMEVDDFTFETEKQIANDYCGKYAEMVLDVYNHSKFQILRSLKELIEYLKYKRAIERFELSFCFTILKEYPKTIVLGYIKKTNRLVVEFIEVQKKGFIFHNKYFCSIMAVESYFRSSHNMREYCLSLKRDISYRKKAKVGSIIKMLDNGKSKIIYLPMLFKISLISLATFQIPEKKRLDKFIYQEAKKEVSLEQVVLDPSAQKSYWDNIYKKVEEEQKQRRLQEERRMQERRNRGRGGRGRGRGGLKIFDDEDGHENRQNRPWNNKRRKQDDEQEEQPEFEHKQEEGDVGWGDYASKKLDSNLGWNSENSGNKREIKDWNKQGDEGWKGAESLKAAGNVSGWGDIGETSNAGWGESAATSNDGASWGNSGGDSESKGTTGWGSGGGETSWGGSGDTNNDSGESRPRGGRGGSRACFKCGNEGHMSRDCTEPQSENRGGSRACFKCGNEGHMSRDCTEPQSENRGRGRGRGGRGGNRACFKCGSEGHMSRECTEQQNNDNNGGSDGAWGGSSSNAGESSGWGASAATSTTDNAWGSSKAESTSNAGWGASAATSNDGASWGNSGGDSESKGTTGWGSGGGETSWGGSGDTNNENEETRPRGDRSQKGCFKCGGDHMARDCTNEDTSRGRGGRGRGRGGRGGNRACFKCGSEGHMSRECTEQQNNDNNGGSDGAWGGSSSNAGESSGWGASAATSTTDNAWGSSKAESTSNAGWGASAATSNDGASWGNSGGDSESKGTTGWGSGGGETSWGGSGDTNNDSGESRPRGGRGGSRACFKCGNEGHMSRDCTEPQSENRGGSRACFKCGNEGHMSRDCTEPQSENRGRGRGRGGRGGNRACFKCGSEGHMSRECTEQQNNDNNGGSDGAWGGSSSNAGESSGWGASAATSTTDNAWGSSKAESTSNAGWGASAATSNDGASWGNSGGDSESKGTTGWGSGGGETSWGGSGDTNNDSGESRPRGGRGGSRACFKCGNEGHMSRDCTEPQNENRGRGRGRGGRGGNRACFKCGSEGHMSRECTEQQNNDNNGGSDGAWGGSSSNAGESSGWGASAATSTTDNAWGSSKAESTSNAGWGASAATSNDGASWGNSGGDSESKGTTGWGSGGGETSWGGSGDTNNDSGESRPRGGRGGSRACFKCGNEGHMSRDCTEPQSENRGRGGRGGNRACFKCGNEGHMSRDCTEPQSENRGRGRGRGGRGGNRACFKCGNEGHMSRDCTEDSNKDTNCISDSAWGSNLTDSSAWGASAVLSSNSGDSSAVNNSGNSNTSNDNWSTVNNPNSSSSW